MVKVLAIFCAALFSCLAIAPASARAAVSDQSPGFTVSLASLNGSGCPSGSTALSAPDDTTFTVTYSQYIADAGGGAPPGEFRKNCQLNLNVGVPSGWTFGIASEQYRGFANLGTGAHSALATNYYFSGIAGNNYANQSLSGPMTGNYELDASQPVITFAPCHWTGTMNINTSLLVLKGTDPSFFNQITMDSTDVHISTFFHLSFRQC